MPFYDGESKSLMIWTGTQRQPDQEEVPPPPQPFPENKIVPADLGDWSYRPRPGEVAVDPELGRLMFAPGHSRDESVWVSYSYAFSADMGGGEYTRPIGQPARARVYRVGPDEKNVSISEALARWRADAPPDAVIEIADSGVYAERIRITLKSGQSLQLRAANGKRPVLWMLNWQASVPDSLLIRGEKDSWFVLDGITLTGRGIRVEGKVSGVAIRHSTLVPGWGLEPNCNPKKTEPSVELTDAPLCLSIEHSIVGAIRVERDEVRQDPVQIRISDSIIDATNRELTAIDTSAGKLCAFARW